MRLTTIMIASLLAASAACTDPDPTSTDSSAAKQVLVPLEDDAVYMFTAPGTKRASNCECKAADWITIDTPFGPFDVLVCTHIKC